ncbi:zinc finger CCCH domain-containing protein 48 [Tanacetum coccineum]
MQVVSGIALPVRPDKLYTGSKDETIRVWDFQDSKNGTVGQSRDHKQPPVAWIYGTTGGADALSQETDALCRLL